MIIKRSINILKEPPKDWNDIINEVNLLLNKTQFQITVESIPINNILDEDYNPNGTISKLILKEK